MCDWLPDGREIKCVWWPVANKLYQGGHQLHAKIAATGDQSNKIVPDWLPIACKFYPRGCQTQANYWRFYSRCTRLAVTPVQFACDSPHSDTIWIHQADSRMQFCMRQWAVQWKAAIFWKAHCQNNYLNSKIRKPLKNLRTCATHVLCRAYPSTLCIAWSNLVRQFI